MTTKLQERLVNIANNIKIPMTVYKVTKKGNIKEYILYKVKIDILENNLMSVTFYCEPPNGDAYDEYFNYSDFEEGRVFIDKTLANNQATMNTLKYYGGETNENSI